MTASRVPPPSVSTEETSGQAYTYPHLDTAFPARPPQLTAPRLSLVYPFPFAKGSPQESNIFINMADFSGIVGTINQGVGGGKKWTPTHTERISHHRERQMFTRIRSSQQSCRRVPPPPLTRGLHTECIRVVPPRPCSQNHLLLYSCNNKRREPWSPGLRFPDYVHMRHST